MAALNVPIRIKRGSGVPTQLRQGELAFDQTGGKLYIGSGPEVDGYASDIVELTTPPTVLEDLANIVVGNGAANGDVLVYDISTEKWVAQSIAASSSVAWENITDKPTISTFGESLIDDATAADARTTLGLGSAATLDSTAFADTDHGHDWSDITSGVPASFTPSAHNHAVTMEITGFIESPAAKTYVLSPGIPAAITITNIRAKTGSGTVDIKLQDDGVDIANMTIDNVTTTVGSPTTESTASVAENSVLSLVVSDLQSSPADLAFSVHYTVVTANNA